ncbi:MAG TPA: phage portal protein, partial [Candidatus Limnocylindrales bacterium]|nr:phage portal protein [Candidatus Limnocylindrales bacterium]
MITEALLKALYRAEAPWTVRGITKGLELVTGYRTADLLAGRFERKSDIGSFSTTTDPTNTDWYTLHGFNRIANALYGYASYTGRSVSFDAVLESSAVYSCTKIISEDAGATPFHIMQRNADRTLSQPAYTHPLYDLFETMPNPDMNASAFREALTISALLATEGFARIDRDSKGRVMYLWPLLPGSVRREKN